MESIKVVHGKIKNDIVPVTKVGSKVLPTQYEVDYMIQVLNANAIFYIYKSPKLILYASRPHARIFFTIVVVPPSKSSERVIIIAKTKRVKAMPCLLVILVILLKGYAFSFEK